MSIFRALAEAVEHLGERKVAALLRDAIAQRPAENIPLYPVATKKKGGPAIRMRDDVIRSTIEKLREASSREEGHRHVVTANFSRRELEALARSLDIPVRKDMRVEDLEDLVVNMTVGGRLNSRAIRGTD